MAYGLSGSKHLYAWLAETDEPERREVMLTWIKGVCIAPRQACTGSVDHKIRLRSFYFADIPVANTRVTYQIVDVPARCVHLLRINDDDFGLPAES